MRLTDNRGWNGKIVYDVRIPSAAEVQRRNIYAEQYALLDRDGEETRIFHSNCYRKNLPTLRRQLRNWGITHFVGEVAYFGELEATEVPDAVTIIVAKKDRQRLNKLSLDALESGTRKVRSRTMHSSIEDARMSSFAGLGGIV